MKALLALVSIVSAKRRLSQAALRLAVVSLLLAALAHSQFGPPPPGTDVRDATALKPPAGARVAIVEFLDLQCPDCARANPVVNDAVTKYRIPLVRYDFPLPFHSWSLKAAVNARWFDTKDKAIGAEYRDEVFANQPSIKSHEDLTAFTQKFATEHKLQLPAAVDPSGELTKLVKADYALGQRIGVEHTPTIWIVTAGSKGSPFVEVVDRGQLFQMIEQALKDTGAK
jgi:protein-disulfide isomerase